MSARCSSVVHAPRAQTVTPDKVALDCRETESESPEGKRQPGAHASSTPHSERGISRFAGQMAVDLRTAARGTADGISRKTMPPGIEETRWRFMIVG